ncbi:MAG: endonuclease [Bacilli bacterium]|nr:endonuclease [Bacilli bacterium]
MKKAFKFLPFAVVLPAILGITTHQNIKQAFAASGMYEESKLPTTIDLNDYTDAEIRNYYADLNSKSEDDRKGQNLLKSLKPILMKDQKYYSYDKSGDNYIWKIYEISDRDWAKSPASSTTYGTYDSATNTISNYQYGSSSSESKNNPYVHALYVDRSQDNPKTAWTAHTPRKNPACIEREHIWPKSHGFDADEVPGARGDLIHLWAADGGANGIHSNYFYGYVDQAKKEKDSRDDYSWTGANFLGPSKTYPELTGKVFEPQDCDKGDIARACFYMVARYNNLAGDDNDINSANPNLCLTDDVTKSEEVGTSTKDRAYALGVMKDLLEWNELDPVDDYEIHRNNLLHRNYTNNRNPFIDYPEWANIIWGDVAKAANPATDPLNGGNPNAISDFVVNDVNYGTEVNPTATAITGDVSFGYSRSENGPFSPEKPTEAGVWYVQATSIADGDYSADAAVKSFRIIGTPNTITFDFPTEFKEGETIAPTATAVKGDVKFEYSESKDGPFTDKVPTEPGTYYIRATSINSGEYESQTDIKEFKIAAVSFIDKLAAKLGVKPIVIIIGGAVLLLIIIVIAIIVFSKMKKSKKKKIGKKVAKELGLPIPKTSSSSNSGAKKSSSSSSKKSTSASKSTKKK